MVSFRLPLLAGAALLASSVSAATSVANTILVLARDANAGYSGTSGLNAYGIPYQLVLVPQTGITLPTLNSSATQGNYGGIIIVSEVAYNYNNSWSSAITAAQFQQLYSYQTSFGVRMVRLDAYPGPDFGVTTAATGSNDPGCCGSGVEQLVSFSNISAFPTAGLKTNAGVSTLGIYHYPAKITNSSIATEIAQFAAAGNFSSPSTAAVINNFGGRQQLVWFTGFATDWSPTSNFMQHAHIHWMTRGLFTGRRRVYFNTQIDDMHLETDMYTPNGTTFRIRPADLDLYIPWMKSINSRLPTGSSYIVEIGHNGNGDIEAAVNANVASCNPNTAIEYPDQIDTALEFMKPLGTGTNIWPATPKNYTWSLDCAKGDALASWWMNTTNRDSFAHISHTFSHMALNNATYEDAWKEIQFNIKWLAQVGISNAKMFSPNGIIPPAITGLHNGDVIRAWLQQGIVQVVGDNTRPVLLNTQNEYWPLISTVEANGYAGLIIVPRWATTIFYNCDLADCTLQEWINTSAGKGDFSYLLADAKATNVRHLLALHHDPFMFHQANLRVSDVPTYTVGDQTQKMSIHMIWVETVLQELMRLTDWTVTTLKHDDMTKLFTDRMARDNCKPNLSYTYSSDGKSITAVTVTTTGNTCSVPIPVSFPGQATSTAAGVTSEKTGNDPLIMWAKMSGSPVTFTLSSPVSVY